MTEAATDPTTCSLCRDIREEHEPRLKRYELGPLHGFLCGACQTKVDRALMPLILEATEKRQREEVRLLMAEAKARHDAEVETERETLRREAAEAKLRAKRAAENVRQARTYRRKRIENARAAAQRLQSLGVLPDAAIKRAAAKFRVAEDELREEKAA